MANVEVDETELSAYKQVYTAVRQGLANPKTRAKLLEVQAELTPQSTHPEITLRSALDEFKGEIMGEFTKLREETAAEKTARDERESRARLEERWNTGRTAAKQQGYTAEGLEKLEKFMEEEGIANHVHAIPAFEKVNPPPQPVTTGGQRWDFFGAKETRPPDMTALMDGNEDAFLGPAIEAALNQARQR
jgi:hypothetical protein